MTLATLIEDLLGRDMPVAVRLYDGTTLGGQDGGPAVVVRSPDALTRIVQAPGELGFARAYVAGDIDLEGDVFEALALRDRLPNVELAPRQWLEAGRLLGLGALKRLPPPDVEATMHGRRHSKERDRAAISYHYDVSNDFYRMVLGPSMAYSCAVWSSPGITLETAQANKYDLICRKLALQADQRLLDVGCGWGGMVLHAAEEAKVDAVGVTLSSRQQEWAAKAIAERGAQANAKVRLQDYRDVDDGPYDAISSIGMFEHVGAAMLRTYFERLYQLLKPGGRLLNHGISRQPSRPIGQRQDRRGDAEGPAGREDGGRRLASTLVDFQHLVAHAKGTPARTLRDGFIDRYVFPDSELQEVGSVVSVMQQVGFEVRHVESLREHYALTLREWVANLERHWDEAVDDVGVARARVWRLYMAASALNFEAGRQSVHQVLAVKPEGGRSGLPLRPTFQ